MTAMRTLHRLFIHSGALLTLLVSALWGLPASGQTPADPNAQPPAAEAPAAAPATPVTPADAPMPAKEPTPAMAKAAGTTGGRGFSFRLDPLVLGVLDSHVDNRSAKFEEYRDTSNG